MSEILNKLVIDCSTGEEFVIPLTEEEVLQMEADRIASEEREAEEQAVINNKIVARQSAIAKLLALGLTEEEANALIN